MGTKSTEVMRVEPGVEEERAWLAALKKAPLALREQLRDLPLGWRTRREIRKILEAGAVEIVRELVKSDWTQVKLQQEQVQLDLLHRLETERETRAKKREAEHLDKRLTDLEHTLYESKLTHPLFRKFLETGLGKMGREEVDREPG